MQGGELLRQETTSYLKSRDFDMCCEGQNGAMPTYLQASSLESIPCRDARAQEDPQVKPNTDSRIRQQLLDNLEETPHISDSNHHKRHSLLRLVLVSIHSTLFPPNKHFICFTTFCPSLEIQYTAEGPGPHHWPLGPGG